MAFRVTMAQVMLASAWHIAPQMPDKARQGLSIYCMVHTNIHSTWHIYIYHISSYVTLIGLTWKAKRPGIIGRHTPKWLFFLESSAELTATGFPGSIRTPRLGPEESVLGLIQGRFRVAMITGLL